MDCNLKIVFRNSGMTLMRGRIRASSLENIFSRRVIIKGRLAWAPRMDVDKPPSTSSRFHLF